MANAVSVSENATKQYIVVKIGNEQYGLDISYVDNIVRLKMELTDDTFTDASRIIILKIEDQGTIGIIVDEVKEVVELANEDIERSSKSSKNEKNSFIFGIGKHGDDLISLFDISAVVDESENI